MPNEVYEAAVEGLSSLVSPRVAKRIIDDSLRATSRTADDVSRSAMRRLLLGRVRSELEGVMPAAAVGPGLVQLAEELSRPTAVERRPWWRRGRRERPGTKSADRGAESTVAERHGVAQDLGPPAPKSVGVTRSSVYLPGLDIPLEPPESAMPAVKQETSAAMTGDVEPERNLRQPAEVKPLPLLTEALVERALRAFADLETVRQVVAVQHGEVLQSSGTGIDAEKLKGLSVATTGLLSKAGSLRVFSIEHEAGVLFLFPMRAGALVVLTQPKVNIGAVLSARAALEEAA